MYGFAGSHNRFKTTGIEEGEKKSLPRYIQEPRSTHSIDRYQWDYIII